MKRKKSQRRTKPKKKKTRPKKRTAPKKKLVSAIGAVRLRRRQGSASGGKAKLEIAGPQIAYLGLGSNVGDREEYIDQAIFLLKKTPHMKVRKASSIYETSAEGVADQPPFLNSAVEIKTTLPPHKLLDVVQSIENTLGREREIEWGPRTIDIDILLYGKVIISDDRLQVPHPLLHERLFALMPLAEIAPDVIHPALELPIKQIFEERSREIKQKYDDVLPGFKQIKSGMSEDYERWDYRRE